MPKPIIQITGVTKSYHTELFSGIADITVVINKAQITAVVGESGSGKSTLLKLIYGLLSPDSGSISYQDKPILGPNEKLIPGHDHMKMVTQNFDLNTYAKVYDNISSMLSNTNLEYKKQKSIEMMDLLRIGHLANKRVADLSGGEQQRVAIARAIVTQPKVLLMDEPFSQVDALLKTNLREDIKHLSKALGITIIIVSHDPVDGLSLADEIIILSKGKLIENGSPETLYNYPKNVYTARLLANCNVITKNQALAIGIPAGKNEVIIYPERISIGNDDDHKTCFLVKEITFKGAYEELVLVKNNVNLRALNYKKNFFKIGQQVSANVTAYLEYN